ncbi:TetR/AcrR family transcriptional regulator [Crocinitomix catalasitica]|uniref:TetR/AcrR family transcriptional regulator n=1 Tax=Crocinitomix catalasitica TaxID=184607 RepID=UPI0006884CA6|nr:TetR/AcrR family transcriptional regulator [Crocinitomix catalasitica]
MPSKTFLNLPKEKRESFIQVSLKEFSENNFETASVNRIIKELGISRGSVYQYFTDKLGLWLYLKEHAEKTKMENVQSVNREDFDTFWDYYRELYIKGADFDLLNPLCSKFLYKIAYQESSKEVRKYINNWKIQADQQFREWVQYEQSNGSFNSDISLDMIVHFMITISTSLVELLQNKFLVDFDQHIKNDKSILADNISAYSKAVDEIVSLLSKALK